MNKPYMLPLNLQLFAGDEDGSFDDGFDSLPAEDTSDEITHEPSDFEQEDVTEPTSEDEPPVEETKEPETPQQRMLRLKVDRKSEKCLRKKLFVLHRSV